MANANNCSSENLYASLDFCEGSVVLPGIRKKAYYIPKRDIAAWPVLPKASASGSTMASLPVYTGNFTLAADKTWLPLMTLDARNNVRTEATGEKPSRLNNNQATLVHPGTAEEAAGFAMQANNDDMVYLVQGRDGKFRVIGNEEFATDTQVGITLGEGVQGEAGTTLEVAVLDKAPLPFYPGNIVTPDGTISGADGSPVTGNGFSVFSDR